MNERIIEVSLPQQTIIEFAYAIKDLIEPHVARRTKLCFEEANCYTACYYTVRELLDRVEHGYTKQHADLVQFYDNGKYLISEGDRLNFDDRVPF